MKKFLIIFITFILLGCLTYFVYNKLDTKINLNNINVEINSEHKIKEFVEYIKNGKLTNGDDVIKFDSLGNKEIEIQYKNRLNKELRYITSINVVDTEKPIIEYKENITITVGDKVDLLKDVKVTDNSNEEITPEVVGEYNIKKSGTYKLKYVATDSSGNKEEKEFSLIVKDKVTTTNTQNKSSNKLNKYYIKVNKTLNVVMVYGLDSNNNYTNLIKTFVCSAGENTPVGTYSVDAKSETLLLEGGVYGHYTTRFLKSRGMWFHSVPYFTKPKDGHWNDLEYEEYNKLGTLASKGCIRLAVIDAKWIYDNISKGTTVEIYESDTLPEGAIKPSSIKIDVNSENRGWDPTDPDSSNQWKK